MAPEPAQPPTRTPFGTFPFAATDSADAIFAVPGVEQLGLTLTDDDDGSTDAAAVGVIVTGTADTTRGNGWWKHQYSGNGSPHIDESVAAGYLENVDAVSGVFSELTPLATASDAHAVLSPTGSDGRARAEADLLAAWLHFASGAVAWDATVALGATGVPWPCST